MRARLAVLFWANVAAVYRILPRRCPVEMDATYSRLCRRLEDALRRTR